MRKRTNRDNTDRRRNENMGRFSDEVMEKRDAEEDEDDEEEEDSETAVNHRSTGREEDDEEAGDEESEAGESEDAEAASEEDGVRETRRIEKQKVKKQGNVVYAGGSKEARRYNQTMSRRQQQGRMIFSVVTMLVLIAVAVVCFVYLNLRQFRGYKVIHSTDVTFETNAAYTEFGGNLLKYTPDGVSYINANGDTVWTAGIDMKVPIAETNGDYAVVADKGGNNVAVFSLEGQVSNVTMPYSILDVSVASQGAFTVVLESDTTNYVNMYSKTGAEIYEIQTSIDKSGYPLDITISNDGQKLFTSYFMLDGVEAKNALTAYNFGEVGQNENADRMVGGFTFTEELFAKVQFISNDVVAAFSDQEIVIYSMKEKPTERKRIAYEGDIQSIFYYSTYIGIIERSTDAEDGSDLIMRVFDTNGDERFSYPFTMTYDNIYASEDDIIVTGGNQCLIVTKNGRTKFRYAFDTMIRSMIPSSGTNEYIVTLEGRTETIRLKSSND